MHFIKTHIYTFGKCGITWFHCQFYLRTVKLQISIKETMCLLQKIASTEKYACLCIWALLRVSIKSATTPCQAVLSSWPIAMDRTSSFLFWFSQFCNSRSPAVQAHLEIVGLISRSWTFSGFKRWTAIQRCLSASALPTQLQLTKYSGQHFWPSFRRNLWFCFLNLSGCHMKQLKCHFSVFVCYGNRYSSMAVQQFRSLDSSIQILWSLVFSGVSLWTSGCVHWLAAGGKQGLVPFPVPTSAGATFDSWCGSTAAIVYFTINCLHSSLLLQVLNLLRLPVWDWGCQLADREVLVLQLLEVINSPNCQKVTAGRKFLPWGHSWIPATCSLIYQ